MILIGDFIFAIFTLLASILLLWVTTEHITHSKKISKLLPFFFSGILLCFSAALNLYGIFDQKIWFALELSWAGLFLWIFVNLWGIKK